MSPAVRVNRETIISGMIVGLFLFGLLVYKSGISIGGKARASTDPDAAIPVNPALRTGTLKNGMRYFVQANAWPEKRAEIRLVVNAGSVLEDQDQRGLAHAVEHMLFRGTKHFPGTAIRTYLESIGMRGGDDVNARTAQDETVYEITVPSDHIDMLDTAFATLADMAFNATFDAAQAATEAGIVFEEWRTRNNAFNRMRETRNVRLFGESPYATRPPIGDTAVLRRFDVRAMRRFYETWYRPEFMGIVAVGDFDDQVVLQLIRKHFNTPVRSSGVAHRPAIAIKRARTLDAINLTDPEATSTGVSIWMPRPSTPIRSIANYRREVVAQLWRQILNARLENVESRPGSKLLDPGIRRQEFARSMNMDVASTGALDGDAEAALEVLVSELARLAKHGAIAAELTRQSTLLLRQEKQSAEWTDRSEITAESYVREFLTGTTAINSESEYVLALELVPTITLDEVNAFAASISIDSGALIVVSRPPRNAKSAATPAALIARAAQAANALLPGWTDDGDTTTLHVNVATPGSVVSERELMKTKVFDWTLSNGMRVILMPTDFVDNQVWFQMVGPGGASLASDAEYPSAYLSDRIVQNTGIGQFTGLQLSRLLDTTTIHLTQSVSDDGIQFAGDLAPYDLETLFELLHLHFSAPRVDSAAFRRFYERSLAYAKTREADADEMFDDTLALMVSQNHKRALTSTSGFVKRIDLGTAIAFWRARMANASNFTLVLVGDFALDRIRPFVTRYLASLPAGHKEFARDAGMRFPDSSVRRDMYANIGSRAHTEIVLAGTLDTTSAANDALYLVRDVADHALNEQLRETLGGTYGVQVYASRSGTPPHTFELRAAFDAAPHNIDSLANDAMMVLNRLRVDGPDKTELEHTRAARTRDLDGQLESNAFWSRELMWHTRMGWPLDSIATHQQTAEALTMEQLRDACASLLQTGRVVRLTMYPERMRKTAKK